MAKTGFNKIKTRRELRKILNRLKKPGKKIVFTNGCFDILHVGHIYLFKKAKTYGDILVVAINSDASLKRLKGSGRPLVCSGDRLKMLSSIEYVDYVTVYDEDTPVKIIDELSPDVLVKGGDYKIKGIIGRELVKKVIRFPVVKGKSTTGLIKKIVKFYGK